MMGCGHVWGMNDRHEAELMDAWCVPCVRVIIETGGKVLADQRATFEDALNGHPLSQLTDAIERAGALALMVGTAQRGAQRWKGIARKMRAQIEAYDRAVFGFRHTLAHVLQHVTDEDSRTLIRMALMSTEDL